MTQNVRVFIAFGANLGDAVRAHVDAVRAINALPGTRVRRQSSLYRSAPIGVHGHPDYINSVIEAGTTLSPHPLLDALLSIEHRHGRTRGNGISPRTMDLDLLVYGDACIDDPGLRIPHPRMHQRAFVLLPLAELEPELVIPGRGRLDRLLEEVADQPVFRIARIIATDSLEDAVP